MIAIDMGLAFLEGLALIVSPCILPVLPLVLAASVEGGRRRPYGIILGFVLAFSLFAILARKLVALLGNREQGNTGEARLPRAVPVETGRMGGA